MQDGGCRWRRAAAVGAVSSVGFALLCRAMLPEQDTVQSPAPPQPQQPPPPTAAPPKQPLRYCLDTLQENWAGWPGDGCFQRGVVGDACPNGTSWGDEYRQRCNPLDLSFPQLRHGSQLDFLRGKRLVLLGDSQLREASGLLAWALKSPVVLTKAAANMWNLGQVVAPLPPINATAFFKFAMSPDHIYQWMSEYNGTPADVLILSTGLHDMHLKEGSPEPVAAVEQRMQLQLRKVRRAFENKEFPLFANAATIWMESTLECRSRRTFHFLVSTGKKMTTRYRNPEEGVRKNMQMQRKLEQTCDRAEGKLVAVAKQAQRVPLDAWLKPHKGCGHSCTFDGMHDKPCSYSAPKRKKHAAPALLGDMCFKPFAFARLQQLLALTKMLVEAKAAPPGAGQ